MKDRIQKIVNIVFVITLIGMLLGGLLLILNKPEAPMDIRENMGKVFWPFMSGAISCCLLPFIGSKKSGSSIYY